MPAWTPSFAVINSRAIAENLLTYFEANQVEAILWAHGSALKPIARFENSRANINLPVYPAILFSDDNSIVDYAQDAPIGSYSLTFDVMTQHATPATAVMQARSYETAIASMIRNIPNATLYANAGTAVNSNALQTVEVGFEQIKANEAGTDFMQQFQIRATYLLQAED